MLEVRDIWKTYEGKPLLNGVSFTVHSGETICLLGPSGGGKSTLLRIIAGLETPEKGEITWEGKSLKNTAVHLRNFGLMFQDYALFPHRTVWQNVAFGLRMKQQTPTQEEIDQRVREMLRQVNMESFAERRVTDLSGGEQQRVALARALAPKPRLLMLDEPLGALDFNLREQLLGELRESLRQSGIPAIYVTHDQEEAFAIADRLILLHEGKFVQSGTPQEVYRQPLTSWVARFFGLSNLLSGEVINIQPLRIRTSLGMLEGSCAEMVQPTIGQQVSVLIRPTGARQVDESGIPEDHPPQSNQIQGVVTDCVFHGESFRTHLKCKQESLAFYFPQPLQVHTAVNLNLECDSVIILTDQE